MPFPSPATTPAFPSLTNWFRKGWVNNLKCGGTGSTAGYIFAPNASADTWYCALYTDQFVATNVNFDTNDGLLTSPWTANQVSDAQYTNNGTSMGTLTADLYQTAATGGTLRISQTTGTSVSWSNTTWNTTATKPHGYLVYNYTATSKWGLVAVNLGEDKVTNGGVFQLNWATTGILAFS